MSSDNKFYLFEDRLTGYYKVYELIDGETHQNNKSSFAGMNLDNTVGNKRVSTFWF